MKSYTAIFLIVFAMWGMDSTSAAKSALKHSALSDDLAAKLSSAEKLVSSHVTTGSKSRSLNPVIKDLKLDSVFFHIDTNTALELADLKLNNVPSLGVNSVKPNLEYLTMNVDASLDSLVVLGSFKVVNKDIFSSTPEVTTGEFTLSISDIHASGKVGLTVIGDSFLTVNYDVDYEKKSMSLTTRYFESDGTEVTSSEEDGGKMVEKLDRQIKHLLNKILKINLDEVLSDLSIDRLIGVPKLVEDYNEHVKQITAAANSFVDAIVENVDNYLEVHHNQEIPIPDIETEFSKKMFILWSMHGQVKAQRGHLKNIATLRRTSDISMDYDKYTGAVTIFGNLGLTNLQLGYDLFSVKFINAERSGKLEATVGDNSIFIEVKINLNEDPIISLQDLHVEYTKDIQVDINGLDKLQSLVPYISPKIVGMLNSQIADSLYVILNNYIGNMLSHVDPSKYLGQTK